MSNDEAPMTNAFLAARLHWSFKVSSFIGHSDFVIRHLLEV